MRVQLLRMIAILSTTALFIPLCDKMARVFECEHEWLGTGWLCFEGYHAVVVAVAAVAITLFTCFALIGKHIVVAIVR